MNNTVVGDKLWEGNAQAITTIVKEANQNGTEMIVTYMLQVKGVGKASGLDGVIFFTTKNNSKHPFIT